CSMNRIGTTMRGVAATALFLGALVAVAPAFAQTPATIQPGVTIHTVNVGGMTADEAKNAVHDFAATPFALRFRARALQPAPWSLGVKSKVNLAVSAALGASANTHIPLTVSIDSDQLRHYTEKLANLLGRQPRDAETPPNRLGREPRDAHVRLSHLRPHLSKPLNGYVVRQRPTRRILKEA